MRNRILSLSEAKSSKFYSLFMGLVLVYGFSFAQPWTENFDSNTGSTYLSSFVANGRTWTCLSAGNFDLGNDYSLPSSCAINDDTPGAHLTTPNLNTCGTISFYCYCRSGAVGNTFQLQVSENGGAFSTVANVVYGTYSSYTFYTYDVNSSAAQVNVRILNDNQSGHLMIDDFSVTAYSASSPTLISSPTTLTGFTYIVGNGPSTSQSFNLSGTNLTGAPGNITISGSTNYEVSNNNSTWGSSTTIAYSTATLSATPVYVRLKAGLSEGTYNENISYSGGGVTSTNFACNGNITASTPAKKILFDASSGQSLASADWVVDADTYNVSWNSSGVCYTGGSEANAQQTPSPGSPTGESDWTGANSKWAYELFLLGYEIESLEPCQDITYGDAGNPQDLSNYDVFICNEPNVQFTSAEKTAIIAFVNAGGGLFMVADHGDTSAEVCGANTEADRNCDGWNSTEVWNDLMSGDPFGIQFDHNNTASPTSSNVISDATDPILHNSAGDVASISFNQGATMTINTSNNASAKGVVFMTGTSLPASTNAMVSYASYGAGRVVGLGDSSPTSDGTGDPSETLYNNWADNDNGTIIMNATIWLAEGSTRLVVSPSSLSGFTYAEGSGPSTNQSFTVNGYNLVGSGNITVTGSTNYEVSTDGTTFTTSVTLPYASGIITSQPKTIYVRLKAGLTNASSPYNSELISISGGSATTVNVTCNGTVSAPASPVLTSSVSTLTGFNYTEGSGPSTNQTFTISGSNLSGTGNITVTGTTNYEVSTDGSTFASSVTYPYASGVITSQPKTVYVRLKSGLTNASSPYNSENIAISGGSATTINVTCSGTVSASGGSSPVFISEYSGAGYLNDFNDEYIELTNNSGVGQDLTGWKLLYYNSTTLEATINLSGSINANSAYLVAVRNTGGTINGITPNLSGAFASMNSTGYVILKNSSDVIVDQAGSSTDKFADGTNYEFTACGTDNLPVSSWVNLGTGNGTPGVVNCVSTGPEINIQENSTNYLTGSTYNFGDIVNGSSSAVKTFTIQNTGTSALAISGTPKVAITGTNAAEFTIDQTSTSASIAASGTTTFTISFSPSSVGAGKTAAISIANDDSDENPYIINLTGNGTAPDVSAPTVSTYSPPDEATDVAINSDFVLTFNENVQKATGNVYIKLVSDNSTMQTIDITNSAVTVSGTQVTINPPTDLATLTAYYITIDSGAIEDMSNNDYTGISLATTWNFTTADVVTTVTCIDEDFESGLSTSYVTGSLTLSDGNWTFSDGGFKNTNLSYVNSGLYSCQIKKDVTAYAATPILYNAQSVTFWVYGSVAPVVKYGSTTIGTSALTSNGASAMNQFSAAINATTSEKIYFYGNASTTTYLDDVLTICEDQPCIAPVISSQPSTSTQNLCKSAPATALSVTASPASSYQWYSNTSASNSGGTLISGATSSSYTPSTSNAGTLYYYCIVYNQPPVGCSTTSDISGAVIVTANPIINETSPSVCDGANITLTSATTGGTWTSDNTSIATINSSTGQVLGIDPGSCTITYTKNGCYGTSTLTVQTNSPVISGTATVCAGSTTTLSGSPTGGTWSSGTTSVASVNSSTGLVTGVAGGSSIITYTTTCGSDTETVTVTALPTISGDIDICAGSNATLSGNPAGGTWSSNNTSVATINSSSGVYNGVAGGTSTITYTSGSCSNTTTVTINQPTISGTTSVTIGGNITLTGTPAGGTWSSATPANATINSSTGIVTGVASGTSLITYSVSGCYATTTVTSSAGPCLGNEGFATGATAPAGWTFTNISATYTSAAYYGLASPSLKLETTNQRIETPSFTNATELSFYCYLNAGTTSSLLIEGWDGSSWLTVDNNTSLPISDATAYITYNASSTPALTSGFTKFRFTFTKNSGNGGFDDVTVYCSPDFKEIGLSGNGNAIVDGDATPQAGDFTDFGDAAVTGETVDRIFTIHNFGTQNLNLSGTPIVAVTGDFSIVSQPSSSTVAGGSSLTFTVRFDPTTTGLRTGTISIANDDPNEGTYEFAIQGTGLASSSPWLIDEQFDGVSSMATITNTNTTGFTATGTGTISAATSAACYNRNPNALTFLGTAGSYVTITTPVFANADMLSFWYKQPNENSTNPLLIEQYSPAKAGWTTLATLPGGAENMKPAVYFYPLSNDITQIRFTYTRTNALYQGYLDDVRIRKANYCTSDIKIIQTLIQSCGGNEGINESVVFKTGDDPINVNDLSISWPNVGVGGTEYGMDANQTFTTNPTYITNLNNLVQLSYPACSPVLAPPSGIIPANSYAVIFSGSSPSVTYDFKDACISGTNYYVIFCDNTNTAGRYGNTPITGEKDYTSIIDKATGCYDYQYYDSGIPNTAGALALYDETTRARSYDNFGCEIIILPVELVSFKTDCNNNHVKITWSTASETNNDYYELQKSDDGINWDILATIDGAGNSNEMKYYEYTDKQYNDKISYYRLKQVDYDGNFEYSIVISSSCFDISSAQVIVYPNPCSDKLNIVVENWFAETIKYEITNTVGQVIFSGTIENSTDNNSTQIDTEIFETGLYFIKLSDKNQSLTKKFIKQ